MRARARYLFHLAWESCFANSNYSDLYKEYEQLVDAFGWPVSESRILTYRERKHWINRYVFKLEKEYERIHQQNNSNQVHVNTMGSGVTFGGKPFRHYN